MLFTDNVLFSSAAVFRLAEVVILLSLVYSKVWTEALTNAIHLLKWDILIGCSTELQNTFAHLERKKEL